MWIEYSLTHDMAVAKPPMPNMPYSTYRLCLDIFKERNVGIGSNRIQTSVRMLNPDVTIQLAHERLFHCRYLENWITYSRRKLSY